MATKVLAVLDTAYRATLEEQDDPVVWLAHALKGAGTDLHVLLRGNAVNYGVRGQNAAGLRFGKKAQTQPPALERDLTALVGKGVDVYYVEDDATFRGIERRELIAGLKSLSTGELPALFESYDQIWSW